MKLTGEIAVERLQARFTVEAYKIDEGCPPLGRPLLYEGGTELLPGRFYVTEAPLPEPYRDGCVIFCGLRSAPEAEWEESWIHIPEAGQVSVFNWLQQIFDRLETWEQELEGIRSRQGSVREMLEKSLPVFQNPLLVVGTDFSLEMQAGLHENAEEYQLFRPGPERMDYINALQQDEAYQRLQKAEGAAWFPGHITGFNSWNVIIRRSGQTICRLVLMEKDKPLTPGDGYLLERLAFWAGDLLHQAKTGRPDSENLRSIFHRVLSDRTADYMEISQQLAVLGWGRMDEYLCLVYQVTYLDQKNLTANTICSYMEEWYPYTCSFLFQDEIVNFFNLTKAGTDVEALGSRLKYFIRESFLKAGYSRVMEGHSNLRRQYVQARVALDVGSRVKSYLWIHHFDAVAFPYLLEQCTKRLPGYMVCHPGLLKLRETDRSQHTEYYRTLQVYLEENESATQAARRLFIHRSTFLYRLERIQELLDSELQDPEERLYLSFSYRLLEKEQEKEAP